MKWIDIKLWYKNHQLEDGNKLIRCRNCNKIQKLAIGWDYQLCGCGHYLYDNRWNI